MKMKGEVMAMQSVFKRYELKYILKREQYEKLCECMKNHMILDEYGRHKISNIYFDTDDYRIIRHSIEKPKYKEKLRVRCYGQPSENSEVFIELKKKFKGVVYKRRIVSKQEDALSYLIDGENPPNDCQIINEIDYFMQSYETLEPRVYLSYDREAFYSHEDSEFRMTFDFNVKMRDKNVSLHETKDDKEVLSKDLVLLEVKTVSGLPFWFLDYTAKNGVYKTSFSKYGTAYNKYIMPGFTSELGRVCNA